MRTVPLKEVAEVNPRPARSQGMDGSAPVSFLPMASVSEEGWILDEQERSLGEVVKGYTAFSEGDVLVAKITPCMENGKVALVRKMRHRLGYGSTEFHVLRPGEDIDARFLFYLVWNPEFRAKAARNMTGTAGQKRVPASFLADYPVPLPPLAEQRRIAAILDKADAIRRKRRQAIGLVDDLLRSTFLEMFGDIACGRCRHPVGPVRPFVQAASGKSSAPVISATPTSIPIFGGNGVNGWANRSLFEEPVIVVGRVGQHCGVTHRTTGPAWVTDNAIVVRIVAPDRLNPVYLAAAFQQAPIRTTVERLDLPFINQSILLDFPLPLPPIALQGQFSELVESCEIFRAKLASGVSEADTLFQTLAHRAFRGEL